MTPFPLSVPYLTDPLHYNARHRDTDAQANADCVVRDYFALRGDRSHQGHREVTK